MHISPIIKTTTSWLLIFILYFNAGAQHYNSYQYFATKEGLPSNFIYKCTQDAKGFLWIATNAGVSRFDGKNFINYTVKQGLPENEISDITNEKNGHIWVNCFQSSPCWYDEKQSSFINDKLDPALKKIRNSGIVYSAPSKSSDIIFYTTNQIFVKKGNEWETINTEKILHHAFIPMIVHSGENEYLLYDGAKLYLLNSNKIIDSSNTIGEYFNPNHFYSDGENFYKISNNKVDTIYKVSNIQTLPLHFSLSKLFIPEGVQLISPTEHFIIVLDLKNQIHIYDKSNMKLLQKLNGNFKFTSAFEDNIRQIWLCTFGKGLIKLSHSQIRNLELPNELSNTNFLSLTTNTTGRIFACNSEGEILESFNQKATVRKIANGQKRQLQNQNIEPLEKAYAVLDSVIFNNFQEKINNEEREPFYSKKTAKFKDRLIVSSSNLSLNLFNTFRNHLKKLNIEKRLTAICMSRNKEIYFGSSDGLYKYFPEKDSVVWLGENSLTLQTRITSIAITADNLVWAATSSHGIIICKNDKIWAIVNNEQNNLLSDISKCIVCGNPGEVWLGTNKGITRIRYGLKTDYSTSNIFEQNAFDHLVFSISNFTSADGLSDNQVNDICFYHDTLYAAMSNGICLIPANIENKRNPLPVVLTEVKINNKDSPVQNEYNLPYDQNNINITFAAPDLSGDVNSFVYTINSGARIHQTSNQLNLQLSSGDYVVQLHSENLDGSSSSTQTEIKIIIATPFYQTIGFWILASITITASIILWIGRIRLQKQKLHYQHQLALEKERSRITADLHDDVGSSLSSLQINSVIARQIMQTDKDKAKYYLDKVIEQSADISSNISDIIWSMKSQEDRLVDLDGRIRNTVSNLLGATNINYKIEIEAPLEDLVQNITAKKNMMLIIKEAINNCAKYSNASECTLHLEMSDNALILTISDNGKGLPANKMKVGNGLQNMRKRTEELKGDMHLITAENRGVQLKFIIPATEIRG